MRYTSCLLVLLILFLSSVVYAQQTNVHFKISSEKKEPISFATISVISTDSTKLEKISDSAGKVVFSLLKDGLYIVRVSAVGFTEWQKNIVVKDGTTSFQIVLLPASKTMGTVIIRSSRPLMRQEDDKTIVDPENLASVSTNAYETIEKTPGLFIDQNGNIYISSTTPVRVYINGREQKMSAADVATMLKSLPPNAIASIEIMRTPSAKYDASGSGGVVNVVLKKGVKIGLTGSVYAGMNQGKYGNQFGGFNLSNNNGSLTTYINLSYGRRNTYEHLKTDRLFTVDSLLSQDALTNYFSQNYYLGFGLSYDISKKWEIGYDGRTSYNKNDNNSINTSAIAKINLQPSSVFKTDINNKGHNLYVSQDVNLKYKIDSLGSEWATGFSYSLSPNQTNQYFLNGEGDLDNRLKFFSAQTNFTKKLNRKLTLESGLKTTGVIFRNTSDYFFVNASTRTKDVNRSAAYKYNEGIHAAYLQASKTVSTVTIKAGARLENTNMIGKQQLPSDTSFSIHRTDLFPYLYISRNIMKIAGYDLRAYLVYRRTISRPAYENLNPSQRFIDPYLFETGNPNLRPQFTTNYEANVSVDERPIIAVGLNETKDIFTQVIYPADSGSKVSYRTYDNLGTNKETYIRALGAIPPGKKFFFVVVGQYNHNFYSGLYEGKPLAFKKGSWTFFTYQSYRLTPLTQLSLSGFLRLKGQQQFYELGTFGELRFNVSQQMLNKKLNVTVFINDIFKTNRNDFSIDQGSIHATGLREADTRRFGINLRYNFGLRKKDDSAGLPSLDPEKAN